MSCEKKSKKSKKLLLISSVGGHLTQLLQLKSLFIQYDYHLVTEKSEITLKLKDKHPISFLVYGAEIILLDTCLSFPTI